MYCGESGWTSHWRRQSNPLPCLIVWNVRGTCTEFEVTLLFHFPPLEFLSYTALIAPASCALPLQPPQVFYPVVWRVQNKASWHRETSMWDLMWSVEVWKGLQLCSTARETAWCSTSWSWHILRASFGSSQLRRLKPITDMLLSSVVLVTPSAITQAMPQHWA